MTVLQELIEKIKSYQNVYSPVSTEHKLLELIAREASGYSIKEKEQMEKAWDEGQLVIDTPGAIQDFETYYKQQYESKVS